MEEAAQDFARQHPDVVLYVSPRSGPGPAPVLRAEYCECWRFGEGTGGSLPCPGPVLSLPGAGAAAVGWGSCRVGGARPDPLALLQ